MPTVLNAKQIIALLSAPLPGDRFFLRDRALLEVLYATGCRASEVVGLKVRDVYLDCDRDTILLVVDQTGAACHEGYPTCFFRRVSDEGLEIVQERVFDPAEVYKDA